MSDLGCPSPMHRPYEACYLCREPRYSWTLPGSAKIDCINDRFARLPRLEYEKLITQGARQILQTLFLACPHPYRVNSLDTVNHYGQEGRDIARIDACIQKHTTTSGREEQRRVSFERRRYRMVL